MGHYRTHNGRVYHGSDTTYTGQSITIAAFAAGHNPPAPAPRPPRTQTPRQVPEAPLELTSAQVHWLVQRWITAGVPEPPTLDQIVAQQREQWRG